MSHKIRRLSYALLLFGFGAQAAEESSIDRLLLMDMDDLMALKVRISTHTEQMLAEAPSVVSVITSDDIRATGATNLVEILQSVPGIYVRPNLFGFRPLVTFRGASSTHTLLMVNGVALRDLVWSSGIFWSGLPVSMIERVEIIRGPGSALFGSDASAGVINVITKTAGRIDRSEAGIRLGSFDTQTGWGQLGGHWQGIDYGLTAELSHSDGHDPFLQSTTPDNSGTAHYGRDGQDLRFSAARGNWRWLVDYNGHGDFHTGVTGAAILDPVTAGSDYRFDTGLLYSHPTFAHNWGLSAELRFHQLGYDSGDGFQERPAGFVCGIGVNQSICDRANAAYGTYADGWINQQRSAERGSNFEVSGLYTGLRKHAIRMGGGYNWEDLFMVKHYVNFGTDPAGSQIAAGSALVDISDSDYAFAPELSRRINYAYLQDIWTLAEDWQLTAGLRYDHYSDFGNALNPRLALVWQTTPRLTSKLMYGQAFRAPSILELYSKTSSVTANPNLTPEKSNTWDLSFTYAAGKRLQVSLDLYRFAQTNLIANFTGQYQNSGDSTTYGGELEANWQLTEVWRLGGNLSHLQRDVPTSINFTAPRNRAYLRSDWAFAPHWNWNLQASHIGQRELQGRTPLAAYTWLDSTVRYAPRKAWQLAASIRNLTDVAAEDYTSSSITSNLPLPERSVYIEAAYSF